MVLTDLDGALLDPETYDWRAADELLESLAAEKIPVCFVSSKTRAELEYLRRRIGLSTPFASENGAAVYFPRCKPRVLGRPVSGLARLLIQIARHSGARVEMMSKMSPRRLFETSGLSGPAGKRAQKREYSEPFLLHKGSIERLAERAAAAGVRIVTGNRFHHIVGRHDKGSVVPLFRERYPKAVLIGVGDGENDLPLLRETDVAVFQGHSSGLSLPRGAIDGLPHGPLGWSQGVRDALRRIRRRKRKRA